MISITIDSVDAAGARAEMLALLGGSNVVDNTFRQGVVTEGRTDVGGDVDDGKSTTVAVEQVAGNKTGRRGKARAVDAKTIEGEVVSKTVEQPNISTQPENRTDPATAAQDKADEDVDAPKDDTLEGVRFAASKYIKKFGMDNAAVDLVPCLVKAAGVGTMSELTKLNDPAKFTAATLAIRAAAAADDRYVAEA